MRKQLFLLTLIMSVLFTAQAGYVIRGIPSSSVLYKDLKNYTLAFRDGAPIAAASMYAASVDGIGKNTIVVIQENTNVAYLFPITDGAVPDLPNDVEVRDFHYDQSNNVYVLCGSRRSVLGTNAFVATITGNFSYMEFHEYSGADMFYSICNLGASNNYYLCGTRSTRGVIASVIKGTLQLADFYVTDTDWEYHKIIAISSLGTPNTPSFFVSGRNPDCTQVGFTTLNGSFVPINSYVWGQTTDPLSHCVVSEDVSVNNSVILASSNGNTVTLNPVTYSPSITISAYRFVFPALTVYFVQDIGIIKLTANTFRISVAGFKRGPNNAQIKAWHGYVNGLSTTINMRNNDYYRPFTGEYEHYKIRYLNDGSLVYKEYTGGYFRSANEMCALFGTPLTITPDDVCDDLYSNYPTYQSPISWSPFFLSTNESPSFSHDPYERTIGNMSVHDYCGIFKGGDPALKSVMSPENESEITTSYDRITLKDIPANTGYQIYNTIGQLISTGVTTPDISTASLSKGVYILRLESGKTFKFVK